MVFLTSRNQKKTKRKRNKMSSQKVVYEDEIEYSGSKVFLRRKYREPNQSLNTSSSHPRQKQLAGVAEKPKSIKLIHTISWICIVVSGLAWIFHLGGMPWTPLFWLRTIPMVILATLILRRYLRQKKGGKRKNEESSSRYQETQV